MPFSDYTELKAAIANWLDRTDLTSAIVDYIALAEADLSRVLRVRDMLKRATATLDDRYTDLPDNCAEIQNIQLNEVDSGRDRRLDVMSPEQLDDWRRVYAYTAGIPEKYAVIGDAIEVAPTPATGYTAEISYYERIPVLSGSNTTNWLLTKHPDLYLFGALMQSAPYLRDDERIPVWVGGYDRVLASIRMDEDRAVFSGSTPRARARVIA